MVLAVAQVGVGFNLKQAKTNTILSYDRTSNLVLNSYHESYVFHDSRMRFKMNFKPKAVPGLNLKGISPGGFKTGPGKRSWKTPKKGGAHYYRKIHILGTHSGRFPGSRTQRPGTGPREIPTSQEGNREKGSRILAGIPNKVPEWVLISRLQERSRW